MKSLVDEVAFEAAWQVVGWDTQNPHAFDGQMHFIEAYENAKATTSSRFARLLCKIGIHRLEGSPVPYVMRCSRCGKDEYIGP